MKSKQPWTRPDLRSRLLQTPPFVECDAHELWGETLSKPRTKFVCQDKPRLVTALTQALDDYLAFEEGVQVPPSPDMLQRMRNELFELLTYVQGFLALRKRRHLSETAQAQTAHIHSAILWESAWNIARVLESLTLEDYTAIQRLIPSDHHRRLTDAMEHAFAAYGPALKRTAFSHTAMFHAMATILIALGIEDGPPRRVAARLRKRRQRLAPSAPGAPAPIV